MSSENLFALEVIYSTSFFLLIFSTEVSSALPSLPLLSGGIDVTVMPLREFVLL